MNSPVLQIKERLAIEDVISSYIKLERNGANFKARCPFHNEKTPSFFVSSERGNYYCFGCGAKGDIFTFVEEFEGLDFKGALKLLAERAGVVLAPFNQRDESEKDRLIKIMEEATVFFENNLNTNQEIKDYIYNRGINEKSIKEFRIGFTPLAWDTLFSYLKKKGFKDIDIEKAGLIKKGDKGFYDRFRGRIMFPIMDSGGRVIAFSGRIFVDDGKSAKYLNSPDTPIFNKSKVLYGIDKAKDSIRKNNFSILVEGQMDLVLSHQAGFKNTVATSGTALSESALLEENGISNLGIVQRLSTNIVLSFDADKAGISAANRAAKIALAQGMDVKVAILPDGVDPADLISKNGPEAWKEAIRNSKHIIEFMLLKSIESSDDSRKLGRNIKEKVLPYITYLDSSIEKMHFVKKISDATGIPEDAIKEDLKKVEQELKEVMVANPVISVDKEEVFRRDYIEKRILGVILWQKTLSEKSLNLDKVFTDFCILKGENEEKILSDVENIKEDLIFEAEVFYSSNLNLDKDVRELMNNLEEEYLKINLANKMKELRLAESNKDEIAIVKILSEYQIINNKIQDIKSGRLERNYKLE